MTLDLNDFFYAVWGEQEGNVVLGQMSEAGPKGELNRSWDFAYPDQLDEIIKFSKMHHSTDLYYSPLVYGNMRDEESGRLRRIPENAISCQVIYQDSDSCRPEKFRLRPSVHVTSSPDRYQDLWVLDEPVAANEAALMSRKIATAHRADGSDPSSWSANKFLRIPGTTNTRHGFPVKVLGEMWGDIYSSLDFDDVYGDVEVISRPIARAMDTYMDSDADLPDYVPALNKISSQQFESLGLEGLTMGQPPEGKRSEMRYRLLCQLFRVDPPLEFEEVLAIAWRAPASSKWREDSRNIRGLIMEAQKAQTEVAYEKGVGVSAPQEGDLIVDVKKIERPTVSLLSDDERATIGNVNHFIRRYCVWAQAKLGPGYNAPYARMNAWTALSAAFSDAGVIPSTGDHLNMYAMGVGDSGSGKSSARRLLDKVTDEIFDQDKGWHIGNASPEALHGVLIERDKKVSIFMVDEAHGWFQKVNNNQWADGVYEAIAEYYDGKVPPMHFNTKKDLSGKTAETFFNCHLMGTMKGDLSISNVLNRSLFYSGFLPRFTWYIGEEKLVTPESMEETNGDGEYVSMGYEPMARQWAAEFNNTKKQLRAAHKRRTIPMNMTDEALKRLTLMKWHAREIAKKTNEWELLEPCLIRLGPNVRRAASLIAIEDGRDLVTTTDLLIAIEQAEEWLANLMIMAERVAESEWGRQTDEIEQFIEAKGGSALYEVTMRKFASRRTRDLMEQLTSLMNQGRVKEESRGGKKYLVLNRKAEE